MTYGGYANGLVLETQLWHWRVFRKAQKEARLQRNYEWKHRSPGELRTLGEFEVEMQERREAAGLGGKLQLSEDLDTQSNYMTWMEFQYYVLFKLDRAESLLNSHRRSADHNENALYAAIDAHCEKE